MCSTHWWEPLRSPAPPPTSPSDMTTTRRTTWSGGAADLSVALLKHGGASLYRSPASPRLFQAIMLDLTTSTDMRAWSRAERARGRRLGFVPTMGALHEGHLRLVDRAKERTDCVVLSVFVNPLQFGPKEDFSNYPRDLARDRTLATERGVDCLFVPEVQAMYPAEPGTGAVARLARGGAGLALGRGRSQNAPAARHAGAHGPGRQPGILGAGRRAAAPGGPCRRSLGGRDRRAGRRHAADRQRGARGGDRRRCGRARPVRSAAQAAARPCP